MLVSKKNVSGGLLTLFSVLFIIVLLLLFVLGGTEELVGDSLILA